MWHQKIPLTPESTPYIVPTMAAKTTMPTPIRLTPEDRRLLDVLVAREMERAGGGSRASVIRRALRLLARREKVTAP